LQRNKKPQVVVAHEDMLQILVLLKMVRRTPEINRLGSCAYE